MTKAIPRHHVPISTQELYFSASSWRYLPSETIANFEKSLIRHFSCKYAIALSSGREALYLALKAHGINETSTVLLPSYCFYSIVEVLRYIGATIVWGEISPQTMALDEHKLEPQLKDIDALIFVQPFGQIVDLRRLKEACDTHRVLLIEDASQSTGASISSIYAGTMGHMGVFSMVKAKNLQAFGGGFILTNDHTYEQKIRTCLLPHPKRGSSTVLKGTLASFVTTQPIFSCTLYPLLRALAKIHPQKLTSLGQETRSSFRPAIKLYQLTSAQASFAILNLSNLESRNTIRRENGIRIAHALRNHPKLHVQSYLLDGKHSFHALPIRVQSANSFTQHMLQHGIDIRQDYMEWFGARSFTEEVVYLPTHPALTMEERERIIHACISYG